MLMLGFENKNVCHCYSNPWQYHVKNSKEITSMKYKIEVSNKHINVADIILANEGLSFYKK